MTSNKLNILQQVNLKNNFKTDCHMLPKSFPENLYREILTKNKNQIHNNNINILNQLSLFEEVFFLLPFKKKLQNDMIEIKLLKLFLKEKPF